MNLQKLLYKVKVLKYCNFNKDTFNLNIKKVLDSTKSKSFNSSCFVCVEGINFDSHTKITELETKGVKFFVCSKQVNTTIPYIIVENTREVLPILLDNFYNNPTKNFKLISVIGTNGKTSTTYFIKQFLDIKNIKCGLIGTSGVFIGDKKFNETLTTPDPILLYKLFDKMSKANCKVVVMEISAHAIKLNKVKNLVSDICIFTNFSQDHLDFFGSMENYKQTKFSYFNKNNVKNAIINIEDKIGKELYEKIKNEIKVETISLNENSNYKISNINLSLSETNFVLTIKNI